VINQFEGLCTGAQVVVGGLVPSPRRLPAVEAALNGHRLTADAVREAAAHAASDVGPDALGDLFASADYRRGVVHVYVERAITVAAGVAAAAM
jgi:carbon-monoxide dehydrogenase medium subunit